ncbi:helix-turn-helix domain-containing protein [Aquipuribacter sp. MA13-6]|uniref:helix-turn-helix domain-containing protein n=1 Tax=unclassified Aquipuribacter TaxID=2635084 RepID=UPI003EE9A5BC
MSDESSADPGRPGKAERAGAAAGSVAGTMAGTVAGSVGGAVDGARTKVEDLGGFLREQRQQARMSLRQLAEVAGVSNPYLSQVERGLRRPSAEVLQQIAKGLRISAEALYVRAGLLDEVGASDVPAAIATDPHLDERQKRALLDVYASFVAAATADRDHPTDTDRDHHTSTRRTP